MDGRWPLHRWSRPHWSFVTQVWDPATGYAAAVWNATEGSGIPVNTAGTAVFKLVVPGSPIQGIAITGDDDPASVVTHPVIVPDGIEITTPQNPPVSTISLAGLLGNADWYVSAVKVTVSATDLDNDFSKSFYRLDDMSASWTEYQSEIQVETDGAHEVAAYSIDTNGNSEDPNNPVLSSFKIDATAPSVSALAATQPNANGWYNSNVTINYTAVDAISGLDSPQPAEPGVPIQFSNTLSTEGTGLSDAKSATDKAGNEGDCTIGGLNIDKTAPSVSASAATKPNTNGWYNSNVTINYTAVDALSGLDTPQPAEPGVSIQFTDTLSAEGTDLSDTKSATDKAGNKGDCTIGGLNIDKTAPTLTALAATQPNANGWYNGDVTINYTIADAISGLDSPQPAQPGVALHFADTLSTEGTGLSDSESATDKAGNSASLTVGGLNIDKTAPILSVVSVPTGVNHVINFDQCVIRFTATDTVSGIDGQPWIAIAIAPTVVNSYTKDRDSHWGCEGGPYWGWNHRSGWLKDWINATASDR